MKVLFFKGLFFWIATKTQRHKGVTLFIDNILGITSPILYCSDHGAILKKLAELCEKLCVSAFKTH
jgi:hypothetical protein